MRRKLHLLVIDPQNDFCDLPSTHLPANPAGSGPCIPALPINGAHADMLRVADVINRGLDGISAISMTLDSHHRLHIAHPTFWMDANGMAVAPYTQIVAAEVRDGRFQPSVPQTLPRALAYLDALEAAGRYTLMVWPVHCEIGSWGQNVHADVRAAYSRWEDARHEIVAKLSKGSNPWTEHYSAVMAEVPDPDDPVTQMNRMFVHNLAQADRIYIAGEAGSHCVKTTVEHIADHFNIQSVSRLVLITDCMSPVSGFEPQFRDFLRNAAARGVQLAKAADVIDELLANAHR
jgi:nicotinamidase-related amidase